MDEHIPRLTEVNRHDFMYFQIRYFILAGSTPNVIWKQSLAFDGFWYDYDLMREKLYPCLMHEMHIANCEIKNLESRPNE